MQGRRLHPTPDPDGDPIFPYEQIKPGDYFKWRKKWWCSSPNGHIGGLGNHTIVEHDDGTITVSPSIVISGSDAQGKPVELWHGFLERGVWRSC
jgi:hypothetical protein